MDHFFSFLSMLPRQLSSELGMGHDLLQSLEASVGADLLCEGDD